MKYNELTLSRQKAARRSGRGISAGRGKTAGRGTKGQGARKSPVRFGFEGGQNPLHARLPKLRGFKSQAPTVEEVYTGQLDAVKKPTVDSVALFEAGLISSPYVKAKLLFKGKLASKKTVKIPAASAKAIEALEKAGGSFERTAQLARPPKKSQKPSE